MKDIKGFEGLYAITEDGRVWRHSRLIKTNGRGTYWCKGRYLKIYKNPKNYPLVFLFLKGRKTFSLIHRLVAEAFIPNPLGSPQVNHKNGRKEDARIENLEWTTNSENMKHAYRTGLRAIGADLPHSKLDAKKVMQIRVLATQGVSKTQIARNYGVARTTIRQVIFGRSWAHIRP